MTLAPSEETKPVFTPEQRQVLSQVYSYLMDIARKRSFQQKPVDPPQAFANDDRHSCHQVEEAHSNPIKNQDLHPDRYQTKTDCVTIESLHNLSNMVP